MTALNLAVLFCGIDVVRLLLDHGADVDAGLNGTPLQTAMRNDLPDIAELLLSRGATIPPFHSYSGFANKIYAHRYRKFEEDPRDYLENRKRELGKEIESADLEYKEACPEM